MKLFSRSEAQSTSKQTGEQRIIEIGLLEQTLAKLTQRINAENDNFDKQMSNQRKVYGEEKLRLQEEIRVLEKKLADKHEERAKIIVPSKEALEKVKVLFKKVQDKQKELSRKEETLDEQLELVHARLDDFSTREGILEESEQKLFIRKEAVEAEAEIVSSGHIRLNKMLSDFSEEYSAKAKSLQERENALSLRERLITDALEQHKKQIEQDTIIINDRRETLDRGFAELAKLKQQHNG